MIDIGNITRKRELLVPNDSDFVIHNRRNEVIVGKRVEIGSGQACDKFYSCTFRDCEIQLRGPGHLIQVATADQVFDGCYIRTSREQSIPSWDAAFNRCYFRGKYSVRFRGTVRDCDFSIADLVSAEFLQSEPLGTVVWPPWPHIVIDCPTSNYEAWKVLPKPPEFNPYTVPKTGIATVLNLARAVTDPEAFWLQVSNAEFVRSRRTT